MRNPQMAARSDVESERLAARAQTVERSEAPRRAVEEGSPLGILGLQGTAGNAAVVQMLQRSNGCSAQDHQHHHDGPLQVQRYNGQRGSRARPVSPMAAARLRMAEDAIAHVKHYIPNAGNQMQGLKRSDYNSRMRSAGVENDGFWDFSSLPPGFTRNDVRAAKVYHSNGGVCQDYGLAAFYYLREKGPTGQPVRLVGIRGEDHALVIIGANNEPDSEWIAVDPWTPRSRGVLWIDHFAYTPDRSAVMPQMAAVTDGSNVASYVAGLIRLNRAGRYVVEWDLNRIGANPDIILDKMEGHGFEIDRNTSLTHRIQQVLAHRRGIFANPQWNPSTAITWSEDKLWLWCLWMVNPNVIAQTMRRGYRGEETIEDAAGTGWTGEPGGVEIWTQDATSRLSPDYYERDDYTSPR
ncbi:hypothetical protein [Actinomadura macra]|uniref:hypothetical protein n=1 Tax=Actinomadura macra TaxID=46164 RepID=UPI00082C5AE4|nr:hypothetical protein [Actinomadura macra]